MSNLTRRRFLQSAGGLSFLALTPVARNLFAAPQNANSPLFTAMPYIQPGENSALIQDAESVVIAWQTQAQPAQFRCEFGPTERYGRTAPIERTQVWAGEDIPRFHYAVKPSNLKLGTRYFYRVSCNGELLLAGYFTTRQPRGARIRFATFGDNSLGAASDRAIAFQAYQTHPDFILNTGDNVYNRGLNREYEDHFFPVYNADKAAIDVGAPLLRSVPFYTVLANHDVTRRDAQKRSCADFDADRDALAYYTALHLPRNGPTPPIPTPIVGAPERLKEFQSAAANRYPRMANYSFDYGDAHFLCLDSNIYLDPSDPVLTNWIEHDLKSANAIWKFVNYHHPAYNIGQEHYREQHMRVLSPIFEKHGVDMVFHGHEHNYQRTRPFRFAPGDTKLVHNLNSSQRLVPGRFTIDTQFDGAKHTRPDGVIYLTTGAGGARLYDTDYTNDRSKWLRVEDDNAPYVAQVFADRHSLTLFEIAGDTLDMKQVD